MKAHLVKIWHDISDVVDELEDIGFNQQRSLVQSLTEALDYLTDEIDELGDEE